MRCADPGDSEDIAQIQDMFFVELSKYSEFKISVHKDMHEKLFCMFLVFSVSQGCLLLQVSLSVDHSCSCYLGVGVIGGDAY